VPVPPAAMRPASAFAPVRVGDASAIAALGVIDPSSISQGAARTLSPHVPPATTLIVAQATSSASPCGPPERASAICQAVHDATGNELLARLSDLLIVRAGKIVLIVVLALLASLIVRRLCRRFVDGLKQEGVRRRLLALRARAPRALVDTDPGMSLRRIQRAETIGALLRSVGIVTVWVVATFAVLAELGIDAGPLIAGAGILGVALGFGAQNLVRDFLSGIFMLLEDQYGVGDVIDAGPATGNVEAVSLRSTRLRDVEGTLWHIPNGEIVRVGNKSQGWSRALLDVQIDLSADIPTAIEAIKGAADGMWREESDWGPLIMEEPEVWGAEHRSPSGVAIRVVVKTKPLEQWKVSRELRARIKVALEEAGIELATPAVWVRSSEPEPAEPADGEAAERHA
jgi:moderate conductance mechanosensitive channel